MFIVLGENRVFRVFLKNLFPFIVFIIQQNTHTRTQVSFKKKIVLLHIEKGKNKKNYSFYFKFISVLTINSNVKQGNLREII